MNAKEIRDKTGLTQEAFSRKYGIPKRTIENWETGSRTAPEYVIDLLKRAVEEDTKEKPRMLTAADLIITKEGNGWTLYIGDESVGWGDLEDIIEDLEYIAKQIEDGKNPEELQSRLTTYR